MFKTNDLGVAAFLIVKGCALHNAYINQHKIYVFEFTGEVEEIRKLAIKYVNSECAMFDAQVKNLKKILKSEYR